MALKAGIYSVLLGSNLYFSLAAPAHDDLRIRSSKHASLAEQQEYPYLPRQLSMQIEDLEPFLLIPQAATPPDSTLTNSNGPTLVASTATKLALSTPIATVTITEEVPQTITKTTTATPITITETVTATPSSATSPSTPLGLGPAKSIWVAPPDLSDLSSFQISKFAGGKENLEIVTRIPSKASKKGVSLSDVGEPIAAMQLLFPAGSIDPAQKPQGGAQFYASPIDISSARNVTLQYSVMFPENFDWVLAGKLPGLYGGHSGCSGGNAALDCFSTRMMWREDGDGELYLYAPKDKQTKALCAAKGSVCDAAYGFSIGRGSFAWKAGDWTTIHQTVYLNTPGHQDGVFKLDVDGEPVIYRNDIFYREDLSQRPVNDKTTKTTKSSTTKHNVPKTTSTTTTADGGLLGSLIGGLLGGIRRENLASSSSNTIFLTTPTMTAHGHQTSPISSLGKTSHLQPTRTEGASPTPTFGVESAKDTQVKFAGIFFSTFFGGHEDKYATPKDQYIWFKDFALAYNS